MDSTYCDVFVVGETFNEGYLAFSFPPGTPEEDVGTVSFIIVELDRNEALLETTFDKYTKMIGGACSTLNSRAVTSQQVTFISVSGLWIILAATMLFSAVVALCRVGAWLYYRKQGKKFANRVHVSG